MLDMSALKPTNLMFVLYPSLFCYRYEEIQVSSKEGHSDYHSEIFFVSRRVAFSGKTTLEEGEDQKGRRRLGEARSLARQGNFKKQLVSRKFYVRELEIHMAL